MRAIEKIFSIEPEILIVIPIGDDMLLSLLSGGMMSQVDLGWNNGGEVEDWAHICCNKKKRMLGVAIVAIYTNYWSVCIALHCSLLCYQLPRKKRPCLLVGKLNADDQGRESS